MANRIKMDRVRVDDLLHTMSLDRVSSPENVKRLGEELADFYEEREFLACDSMGEIVSLSLDMLIKKPDLYKDHLTGNPS